MKFPRRQVLQPAVGAAVLPALLPVAWGRAYPANPIIVAAGVEAE